MTNEESAPPPRQWVGIWLRDQTFWRDVASRALAGVIVVALAAVWAVAVGLLRDPEWVQSLLATLVLGGTAIVWAIPTVALFRRSHQWALTKSRRVRHFTKTLVLVLAYAAMIGLFALGMWVIDTWLDPTPEI